MTAEDQSLSPRLHSIHPADRTTKFCHRPRVHESVLHGRLVGRRIRDEKQQDTRQRAVRTAHWVGSCNRAALRSEAQHCILATDRGPSAALLRRSGCIPPRHKTVARTAERQNPWAPGPAEPSRAQLVPVGRFGDPSPRDAPAGRDSPAYRPGDVEAARRRNCQQMRREMGMGTKEHTHFADTADPT